MMRPKMRITCEAGAGWMAGTRVVLVVVVVRVGDPAVLVIIPVVLVASLVTTALVVSRVLDTRNVGITFLPVCLVVVEGKVVGRGRLLLLLVMMAGRRGCDVATIWRAVWGLLLQLPAWEKRGRHSARASGGE